MYNTNEVKSDDITESGSIDCRKLRRTHQPHRGGSGTHKHKTTKRNRTRSQQNKRSINDYND